MQTGFGYQGLPQWLISLIIMCSCATLCLFMLIVNRLIRFFHMRAIGQPSIPSSCLLPRLGLLAAVLMGPCGTGFCDLCSQHPASYLPAK